MLRREDRGAPVPQSPLLPLPIGLCQAWIPSLRNKKRILWDLNLSLSLFLSLSASLSLFFLSSSSLSPLSLLTFICPWKYEGLWTPRTQPFIHCCPSASRGSISSSPPTHHLLTVFGSNPLSLGRPRKA